MENADHREDMRKVKTDYVASAASVSKDGDLLVTGCSDDTWIRVHNAKTGQLLETQRAHHGPVHTIRHSPDGCLIASGSEDGTVRLWKAVPGSYGLWSELSI
jgi:serine-threonine kinase receptor-associated protein